MRLPSLLADSAHEALQRMEEEDAVNYITTHEEYGRRIGLQEGRTEGLQEGRIAGLQEGLAVTFMLLYGERGKVLVPQLEQIRSLAQLELIRERLLAGATVDEMTTVINGMTQTSVDP